jgi:hypothetical protein
MSKQTLASRWMADDSARQASLERVRRCSALTKPWLVPPKGMNQDHLLPEPFQSDGAMMVQGEGSRLLLDSFSPGTPWYMFGMSPRDQYDPSISDEVKREYDQALMFREMVVQSLLESSSLKSRPDSRRNATFLTAMARLCDQIVVTGDGLARMHDDYRVQVYSRPQYVTMRDAAGDVAYHIIQEMVDPLAQLSDDEIVRAGMDKTDLEGRPLAERLKPLYTLVELQPRTGKWRICQEMNGHELRESDERVSPFFSVPYELAPGEHYGRGPVELRVGALSSIEEISRSLLDMAAILADVKVCKNTGCQADNNDLAGPSGTIIENCRVVGGQVDDIALLQPDRGGDFATVLKYRELLKADFSQSQLTHLATQPRGERVTAQQSGLIAGEVAQSRGGYLVPLEESLQQPILRRAVFLAERSKVLTPLPPGLDVAVVILTGVAQMRRQQRIGGMVRMAQIAQAMGPEAQAAIDMAVFMDVYRRYDQFYEPGIVKSKERMAQDQQAALQQAVAARAADEGIAVAGDAARAALTSAAGA